VVDSFMLNFTSVQGWGVGPKSDNFTQISEYKRPAGA